MWQWLRRSLLTGFVVTVPLAVSLFALVWVFRILDGLTSALGERATGRHVPGLGVLTMVVLLIAVGAVATNVLGRRLLRRAEDVLLRVPVFRTIYAPLKQLIAAFSPDNEQGFKRVVLVHLGGDPALGYRLGFLTKEFALDRGHGPEPMLAVYVPTNQLYLGDLIVCRRDQATFPDLTVEQGINIFLTGGMTLPSAIGAGPPASRQRSESER